MDQSHQTPVAPRIRRGIKLRDMFMEDKDPLSCADFHHEITRSVEDSAPESSGKQQNQMTKCNTSKEKGVIKSMPSVPSYLAKVKDFRGKPLNMGVLDWRRLEKWRWGNKLVPLKHVCSSAISSTLLFSTDESSLHSSGGDSNLPSWQRMHSQPEVSLRHDGSQETGSCTVKAPVISRPRQSTGHIITQPCQIKAYPSKFRPQKFQDQSILIGKKEVGQSFSGANQAFEIRPGKCKENQLNSKQGSEVNRGETRTRLEEPNPTVNDQNCSDSTNMVLLLLPKVPVEIRSTVSRSASSGMLSDLQEKRFSKESNHEQISVSSDTSSCSVLPQSCSKESASSKGSCCSYGQDAKVCSRSLQGMPNDARILACSSVIQSRECKMPIPATKREADVMISMVSRNPSPARNFGHGMARIIKSASSRDHSPQRRPLSRDISSRSVVERAAAALSSDNSSVDKSHVNNKARSSPLRRLLDPFLKAKGPHRINPPQPVKKDPKSSGRHQQTASNEPVHVRDIESAKVLSRFKNVCRIRTDSSYQILKHGSSRLQAILRLAVKNGLPLFTFAIDNDRDVMIATIKKSGAPGKDPSSWVYTFLTVNEIKRKNGIWLTQGPKRHDHAYAPNVIAQMRVTNLQSPLCSDLKCADDVDLREFALLGRDLCHADQHEKVFVPTEELAAVIVKLPTMATRAATSDELALDSRSLDSQIALSATVILPGGIHTVPSKGALSRLSERWTTGGSCDCGGWDLGCQLRVYSSCKKLEKQTNPNNDRHVVDEFKLFSQVGEESDLPVLRMVPLKNLTYSVEFDSSVSPLQTFAVCIAILECSRPLLSFEQSNISGETTPDVPIAEELIQTKASNQPRHVAAPSPVRYFSYPPLSPVGRA